MPSFLEQFKRQPKIFVNLPSQGAFYSFPRYTHSMSSKDMLNYLSDNGVLVRSGTEFGQNGEKHIRIAFTRSTEELEEGMVCLKKALENL